MISSLSSRILLDLFQRGQRRSIQVSGSLLSRSLEPRNSSLVRESYLQKIQGQVSLNRVQVDSLEKADALLNQATSSVDSLRAIGVRLKEIAELASDYTVQGVDREKLVLEADELLEEFSTIARTSSYAGRNLLDGSFPLMNLGGGLEIAFQSISTKGVGGLSFIEGSQDNFNFNARPIINGVEIPLPEADGISTINPKESALAVAAAFNSVSELTGVTARVQPNSQILRVNFAASGYLGVITQNDIAINGVSLTDSTMALSTTTQFVNAINEISSETGVTAILNANSLVTFYAADGRNIDFVVSNGSGVNLYKVFEGVANNTWFAGDGNSAISVQIIADSASQVNLISSDQIFIDDELKNFIGVKTSELSSIAEGTQLSDIDFSDVDSAELSSRILDATLDDIDRLGARIGALHSRVDIRSASLLGSLDALGAAQNSSARAEEALQLSESLYHEILFEQRSASYYHRGIESFRVRSIIENWLLAQDD